MSVGVSAPADVARDLRAAVARIGALSVPGQGATAHRHRQLASVARTGSVSVARLFEAHHDAVAILAEAACRARPDALYGVWASAGPGTGLRIDDDHRTVTGAKPFCSGLHVVDRALVTAEDDEGRQWLVEVALDQPSIRMDATGWSTPALADTHTGSIEVAGATGEVVGGPDWYLRRPGFWHGACGPAACWAGAAVGLVDAAEARVDDDPHRRAHLGALRAAAWQLDALLEQSGTQIDAEPADAVAAERRARSLRHVVERAASEVLDRFGVAFGPRPVTTDAAVARRVADLQLFLRQDHGERDLAVLGRR